MQAEIIKNVKFGIISPEKAKRLSVVKLSIPDTYNEDGYPIDGGLLDQRLGVIDPGLVCKTCGARAKSCPGHFGHIELVRPVIHSEFSKILYMLLQSTCGECHRVLLTDDEIHGLQDKSKKIIALEVEDLTDAEIADNAAEVDEKKGGKSVLKKIRSAKKCPHCGAPQTKIKFSSPTYFYMGDKKLKPDEIRDMLTGINNEDLRILGIDPDSSRPEWLILTYLLVPPVNVRPSITLESGERSEDDLTHKLVDIMRINQRLAQNINAGAPQIIIDDLWELLQYHVTAYFNNETSGIPPARHRSGRALKTLAQRLKGKEGRFRYNLSGKRVNYSARTVISVDPYINLDEVGVPYDIASRLTVPFYVTAWNLDKAKELLARTEYPMILNLISGDGKRKRVIDINHDELLAAVKPGDILERQLVDGDIVLFNRQPSLHRMSIMAHRVRVLPGKTFRINFCVTSPYNADFDGDEMNLHVPQTLEAQVEAKYLLAVQHQVFSPRDGEAVITNNEDGITGMYFLTKDETRLNKDEASYILGIGGIYELPEPDKDGMYRGKDIFSLLLPPKLNFETKTAGGMVRIVNGKLVEGVITKETYGKGNNKLLIKIGMEYGDEVLKQFLFLSSKLADAYVTFAGVTVGVKEYTTNNEIEKAREELLQNTFKLIDEKISQYKNGKLEPLIGYTRRESLERRIIVDLNLAREKAGDVLIRHIDPQNSAMQMARAGSRGSIFQYEQMSMFLGQQATLSGGRIKRGYYTRRVLPHIYEGDVRPSARGFVQTNYESGLSPIDLFMHAVGSRGSEVYKALLTARSGYLYRRLSNALQDLYIEKDFSVRDTANNVVQTSYGGDGMEPVATQFAKMAEKDKK